METGEVGICSKRSESRLTHALATDDVSQPAEEELADECADGRGDLDAEILVRAQFLVCMGWVSGGQDCMPEEALTVAVDVA